MTRLITSSLIVVDAPNPLYAGAQLPLVSFVVVNYNYARYLRQCVQSIFAQTYPLIECIVVDNKSTDDSLEVIADLRSTFPQLRVISESANLGQSAACVDGYNLSRGSFVVFVDADDYYFETFVETHLAVHLSSLPPVGFSSSDMVQVVDGEVIGTFISINPHDAKRVYKIDPGWPPLFAGICNKPAWPSEVPELEKLCVKFVDPRARTWVWAPTSGTMYRRDALALFADASNLRSLRCSTDAFFNYAINALTGSILIERPLAAYRIHGGNQFTKGAVLNNLSNSNEITDESPLAAKFILLHVRANFSRFVKITEIHALWQALKVWMRKAKQARSPRNGVLLAVGQAIMRMFLWANIPK